MTVSFGCHVATSLCLLQRLPSLPFPVCCNNCEARLSTQRSALTGKSCNCLWVVATYCMSFIRVYLYTNFILLQHLPGLSYTGTFFLVATITKKSRLLVWVVSVATVTKLTSELSAIYLYICCNNLKFRACLTLLQQSQSSLQHSALSTWLLYLLQLIVISAHPLFVHAGCSLQHSALTCCTIYNRYFVTTLTSSGQKGHPYQVLLFL